MTPVQDLLCLRLNPRDGRNQQHCTIYGTQTVTSVMKEVGVTRCVDDLQLMPLPLAMGNCSANRDVALNLLRFIIHARGAIIDPPQSIGSPAVEQDRLDQRGLTRSAMCNNPKIPHCCRVVLSHGLSLPFPG